ncbi:hypothetical protein C469_02935 [Halorubrum lipolyticum DSM 21995]|uniref:GmrSD restriction endonucleases N-terminal domain-containing protein n=2 Tax=Halorubrum lipolyticum TaxID=368624 RepID=M0P178_9EURY|nr:hypothetical protein C469_02935 [Halorubrum lipolyticum DSM 21995]
MVSELFESILQDYYTGLLLFWDLDQNRAEQEEWDPIWGSNLEGSPDMAVLDGQQRLSSLYYAIHNPEKKFPNRKSYYVFYLDLIKALDEDYEEAVTYKYFQYYRTWEQLSEDRESWIDRGKVPLAILSARDPNDPNKKYLDSREFQDWIDEFIEQRSSDLPSDVKPWDIRDVFVSILDYSFVHYPLSNDREIRDICNIFAKVNASGMKLSTFDLMNAFLYPSGVELRKELWEKLDNETLKRIDPNMKEYLLKTISLVKQNYCSSKYLYNLIPGEKVTRRGNDGKRYEEVLVDSGEEFKTLWEQACDYAEKAREILMNTGDGEFGAIRTEFIPNSTIVPVLAAILWEYDGDIESPEFKETLSRWYWSAVLSQDYSGSSDTVMAKDFRDWKEWMATGSTIERITKIDGDFIKELNLRSVDKGSARYNAIICLLALNDARDFYKGRIVGTGDFSERKINDHHIFPKKVKDLHPDDAKTFDSLKDSIVNRTLILDETNNDIKADRPSEYIQEMIDKHGSETKVQEILQTHLITDSAYEHLRNDEFDDFAIEREKAIKQHIIDNVGVGN